MNPEMNELHSDGNGRSPRWPRLCDIFGRGWLIWGSGLLGLLTVIIFMAWECRETGWMDCLCTRIRDRGFGLQVLHILNDND